MAFRAGFSYCVRSVFARKRFWRRQSALSNGDGINDAVRVESDGNNLHVMLNGVLAEQYRVPHVSLRRCGVGRGIHPSCLNAERAVNRAGGLRRAENFADLLLCGFTLFDLRQLRLAERFIRDAADAKQGQRDKRQNDFHAAVQAFWRTDCKPKFHPSDIPAGHYGE